MSFVTAGDGTQIYYEDWGSPRSSLVTAGRFLRMTGTLS